MSHLRIYSTYVEGTGQVCIPWPLQSSFLSGCCCLFLLAQRETAKMKLLALPMTTDGNSPQIIRYVLSISQPFCCQTTWVSIKRLPNRLQLSEIQELMGVLFCLARMHEKPPLFNWSIPSTALCEVRLIVLGSSQSSMAISMHDLVISLEVGTAAMEICAFRRGLVGDGGWRWNVWKTAWIFCSAKSVKQTFVGYWENYHFVHGAL